METVTSILHITASPLTTVVRRITREREKEGGRGKIICTYIVKLIHTRTYFILYRYDCGRVV